MKRNEKRSDLIVKLGKKIAQIRRKQNISQEEIAGEVEATPTTLSRIECGVTDTNVSMLERIAKALNVEVSSLFAEAEAMHLGLPRELEEIISLLKEQKHSTLNAALKQVQALVDLTKKQN